MKKIIATRGEDRIEIVASSFDAEMIEDIRVDMLPPGFKMGKVTDAPDEPATLSLIFRAGGKEKRFR